MSEFTIQDLIEQTGVPRRTIYFYTQQGILPPLQGAGLSARYQQAHLLRLKLIPFLRQGGMRLDQIREYFDGQNVSALERRLKDEQLTALHTQTAASPALSGDAFLHYALPQGMTLIVPAEFAAKEPARIKEIIQTIQEKSKGKQELP